MRRKVGGKGWGSDPKVAQVMCLMAARRLSATDLARETRWSIGTAKMLFLGLAKLGVVRCAGRRENADARWSINWPVFIRKFLDLAVSEDTHTGAEYSELGVPGKVGKRANYGLLELKRTLRDIAHHPVFRKVFIECLAYHRGATGMELVVYTDMTLKDMARAFEGILIRVGDHLADGRGGDAKKLVRLLHLWRSWRTSVSTLPESAWEEGLRSVGLVDTSVAG